MILKCVIIKTSSKKLVVERSKLMQIKIYIIIHYLLFNSLLKIYIIVYVMFIIIILVKNVSLYYCKIIIAKIYNLEIALYFHDSKT